MDTTQKIQPITTNKPTVAGSLKRAAQYYGEKNTTKLRVMYDALKKYPPEKVQAAFQQIIENGNETRMPTLVRIRAIIEKENKPVFDIASAVPIEEGDQLPQDFQRHKGNVHSPAELEKMKKRQQSVVAGQGGRLGGHVDEGEPDMINSFGNVIIAFKGDTVLLDNGRRYRIKNKSLLPQILGMDRVKIFENEIWDSVDEENPVTAPVEPLPEKSMDELGKMFDTPRPPHKSQGGVNDF